VAKSLSALRNAHLLMLLVAEYHAKGMVAVLTVTPVAGKKESDVALCCSDYCCVLCAGAGHVCRIDNDASC
jgi:hypothetical protein